MFRIRHTFAFSATHQLGQLPDGHPGRRLHHHDFDVVVELGASDTDPFGKVGTFDEVAAFQVYLAGDLHETHILGVSRENFDIVTVDSPHGLSARTVNLYAPTIEILALALYRKADAVWNGKVIAVALSDARRNAWAEYRPLLALPKPAAVEAPVAAQTVQS